MHGATKIFLIGDSIRLNSERYVRTYLHGAAEIVAPAVNCGPSRAVGAHIHEWAPAAADDIVHLNCGLHDIRYDPGCAHPVCSLAEYSSHLRQIFDYLSMCGTTVIWATSTPFAEAIHNAAKLSRRFEADLLAYNQRSRELAGEYGFAVNDLYAKLVQRDLTRLLSSDGVHFTDEGNQLVGRLIAEALSPAVDP